MKNIRKGVFETNSSSTHSIVISKETPNMYDTIHPDGNGEICLRGDEFGWNWERFNDAMTKANYCAVDQQHNESNLSMLKEVLREHTGAKEIRMTFTDSWNDNSGLYWAYIDHQSQGTSSKAFESKEALKNFIFNPYSLLFTGNDNSDAPMNFFIQDGDVPFIPFVMYVNGHNDPMYIRDIEDTDEIHDQLQSFVEEKHEYYYLNYNSVDFEKKSFEVNAWSRKDENEPIIYNYRFEANPRYKGKTDTTKAPVQVSFDQFLRSLNLDEDTIGKIDFEMKKRNIK